MTTQKLGTYLVWGGYAAAIVAIVLAAHHLPILIAAAAGLVLIFLGRSLEGVKPL